MSQESKTVSFTAWTQSGFKAFLCFPAEGPRQALEMVEHAMQSGWLPREPGVEAGEADNVFELGCMVRREYKSKGEKKACVDFYQPHKGKAGAFKRVTFWINDASSEDALFAATGVRYRDMPIYPAQAALQRDPTDANDCEVAPKKPCKFVRVEAGERVMDNGEKVMTHKFDRFVTVGGAAPSSGPHSTQGVVDPAVDAVRSGLKLILGTTGVTKADADAVMRFVSRDQVDLARWEKDKASVAETLNEMLMLAVEKHGLENILDLSRQHVTPQEDTPF